MPPRNSRPTQGRLFGPRIPRPLSSSEKRVRSAMEERMKRILQVWKDVARWRVERRALQAEMEAKGFRMIGGNFLAHTRGSGMDSALSLREWLNKKEQRSLEGKLENLKFTKKRRNAWMRQSDPLGHFIRGVEKEMKQFAKGDPARKTLLAKWVVEQQRKKLDPEEEAMNLHLLMKAYEMGLSEE